MAEVWYLRRIGSTGVTVPAWATVWPMSMTQGTTDTEQAILGASLGGRSWGRRELSRRRLDAGTWQVIAVLNVAAGTGPGSRVTCRVRIHDDAGAVLATPIDIQSANLTAGAINNVTYQATGVDLQDIPVDGYVTVELEVTQGTRAIGVRHNGGSGYDTRLSTPDFLPPDGSGVFPLQPLTVSGIGQTVEQGNPLRLGGKVRVEIGFLGTTSLLDLVGIQPWLTLDDPVLGKLDQNKLPGFVWVEVTKDVIDGVGTDRGRQRDLEDFPAGQATFRLTNRAGRFDPTNTSSPFFGNLKPMRRVRITYGFRDPDVPNKRVFEGSILDWDFGYERGGDAWVDVRAVDDLALLSTRFIESIPKDDPEDPGIGSGDTPAERVLRILGTDEANWTSGVTFQPDFYNDDEGPLLCGTEWGINVADALRRTSRSEIGAVFFNREGGLVVDRGLIDRILPVTPTPNLILVPFGYDIADLFASSVAFGLDPNTPWAYYHDLELATTAAQLHNDVRVGLGGTGDVQRAVSPESVDEFGRRELDWDTLLAFDFDAERLALMLLQLYAASNIRVESVRVLLHDVRLTRAQRSAVVGIDLLDVVWVVWNRYPAGGGLSFFPQYVDGVRTSYTRAGWEVGLSLSTRTSEGFAPIPELT